MLATEPEGYVAAGQVSPEAVEAFGGTRLLKAVVRLFSTDVLTGSRPHDTQTTNPQATNAQATDIGTDGDPCAGQDAGSARAWLLGDHVIPIRCVRRGDPHQIVLGSDGSLTVPAHHYTDPDGELVLASLLGTAPRCLTGWAILATGQAPGHAHATEVNTFRVLRAALAWARHETDHPTKALDDADRAVLISDGVTPARWEPWQAAGHTPRQARWFLKAGASVEQATPWIVVGLTTQTASTAAAAGDTPPDLPEWERWGLRRSRAAGWAVRARCTPAEAVRFLNAGASLAEVAAATATAPAATWFEWVEGGIPLSEALEWAHWEVDYATAAQWLGHGVDADLYRRCAVEFAWEHYRQTEEPMPRHRQVAAVAAMNPEWIAAWRRMPGMEEIHLGAAMGRGIDPGEVLAWGGLPSLPPAEGGFPDPFENQLEIIALLDSRASWDSWMSEVEWNPHCHSPESELGRLLALHATGYTPALFTGLPADREHRTLRKYPSELVWTAHRIFGKDVAAVHAFAHAGWLCDDLIHDALMEMKPNTQMVALRSLYQQDPHMSLPEAVAAVARAGRAGVPAPSG